MRPGPGALPESGIAVALAQRGVPVPGALLSRAQIEADVQARQ